MKLVPLTVEGIEEGRFIVHANEDLDKVMKSLAEHVKKYGKEIATGSKAELAIKITIKYEGRDLSDYSVKSTTALKLPGRPAEVTVAVADKDQCGEDTLFVRPSGSSGETPHQRKLATDDGKTIDPKSGKAKGEKE